MGTDPIGDLSPGLVDPLQGVAKIAQQTLPELPGADIVIAAGFRPLWIGLGVPRKVSTQSAAAAQRRRHRLYEAPECRELGEPRGVLVAVDHGTMGLGSDSGVPCRVGSTVAFDCQEDRRGPQPPPGSRRRSCCGFSGLPADDDLGETFHVANAAQKAIEHDTACRAGLMLNDGCPFGLMIVSKASASECNLHKRPSKSRIICLSRAPGLTDAILTCGRSCLPLFWDGGPSLEHRLCGNVISRSTVSNAVSVICRANGGPLQ